MSCPVCGHDCVADASTVLAGLPGRFDPCPDCTGLIYDKWSPPPDIDTAEPRPTCGRRFIDEVFAHIYRVMVDEGDLAAAEPLASVGTPLVHPGFAMRNPPYLPPRSLLLFSRHVSERTARRLVAGVPEIRGVVRTVDGTPGIRDTDSEPVEYTLLAGCDVRADIFQTRAGPIVVYKQQSTLHIEFPRGRNEKILSLERQISRVPGRSSTPVWCWHPGLAASQVWRRHLQRCLVCGGLLTARNLRLIRESRERDDVTALTATSGAPVGREPILLRGRRGQVYQGTAIPPTVLPSEIDLTALDLEKMDAGSDTRAGDPGGGGLFIP